jgi:hypothetical protein
VIKLYCPVHTDGPGAEMVEDSSGEWVSGDDYFNVLVDLRGLQKKYDKLVEKLGDLYKEA